MRVESVAGDTLTLAAADVHDLTIRVVAVLREMGVELTGLETREPSLEKVFLHLTDTKVRD